MLLIKGSFFFIRPITTIIRELFFIIGIVEIKTLPELMRLMIYKLGDLIPTYEAFYLFEERGVYIFIMCVFPANHNLSYFGNGDHERH